MRKSVFRTTSRPSVLGIVFAVSGLWLALPAWANKLYVAPLGASNWTVTIDTPIECRLEHTIPRYGQASFTSRASKEMNLDFELDMQRPMGKTADVSLLSMPADWMPGEPAKYMDQLKFFKQFDGYVGGQTAWAMLSELEDGRFPTFSFQDWQRQQQRVDIALSAVAFGAPYHEFSRCLNSLLPYAFEDISFTVLRYQENSDELTKASMQRLTQIAEFVRYSDDIDLSLWQRIRTLAGHVPLTNKCLNGEPKSYATILRLLDFLKIGLRWKPMGSDVQLRIMKTRLGEVRTDAW